MVTATGSKGSIYGWTPPVRVRPPEHLLSGDAKRARVTSLPTCGFVVADIQEDVIIGSDYIVPLRGSFGLVDGVADYNIAISRDEDAPKVRIPLLGHDPPPQLLQPVTVGDPSEITTNSLSFGSDPPMPGVSPRRCRKQLSEDANLLQFADENPHMVHHVEWVMKDPMTPGIMQNPMTPEAALFPDKTVLLTEPPPEPPSDPRRDAAWAAIQTRFSKVFEKPSTLPPYRFVNGTCTLKEGCTVPPRCGVGRLSQEEITYTRAILTDYLHKGWIRPSYSRTAARLFFVTKPNGGLRSVVDYRALNDVLETQYFPPPEWSNIVNQLGDSSLYSTFDCSDFFFQNRLRDEDLSLIHI